MKLIAIPIILFVAYGCAPMPKEELSRLPYWGIELGEPIQFQRVTSESQCHFLPPVASFPRATLSTVKQNRRGGMLLVSDYPMSGDVSAFWIYDEEIKLAFGDSSYPTPRQEMEFRESYAFSEFFEHFSAYEVRLAGPAGYIRSCQDFVPSVASPRISGTVALRKHESPFYYTMYVGLDDGKVVATKFASEREGYY